MQQIICPNCKQFTLSRGNSFWFCENIACNKQFNLKFTEIDVNKDDKPSVEQMEHLINHSDIPIPINFRPKPRFSINNKKIFKSFHCCYFIFNKKSDILYIGKTTNLYKRITEHIYDFKKIGFDVVASFDCICIPDTNCSYCDRIFYADAERYFIRKFRPIYNRQYLWSLHQNVQKIRLTRSKHIYR